MAAIFTPKRLNRIAQFAHTDIARLKEGISLQADSGLTIDELIRKAAADRWKLANQHRRDAAKLYSGSPRKFRSAISRYYYSMYHAMRSCVFISYEGDDHQEHSELPLNIPKDFDPGVDWQNKLKNARLSRNRADYEAYPKTEKAWESTAIIIKKDADVLLQTALNYLRGKGCTL
jgi:uncharacterized protein (UPF0332 family)